MLSLKHNIENKANMLLNYRDYICKLFVGYAA